MNVDQEDSLRAYQWSGYVGKGKAFGTFGELLQGRLSECDSDFLVTFPVGLYSYATFVSDPSGTTIAVVPPHKHKSRTLAAMILDHYCLPRGGTLLLQSDLPMGKGLASSSADLVATARSIASCFRIKIPVTLLEAFMREIEPSDGVMYSGIVSFYHKRVRLREFLGFLPRLTIVSIDEGGEVDTILFNQLPKPFTTSDEQEYQHLLDRISTAVRQEELTTIGQIATRSALLNQKLCPKRMLSDLIAICEEIQGLGVVAAHSGTHLGILLSPRDDRYCRQLQVARSYLSNLTQAIWVYQSLSFKGMGE